MEVAGGEAFAEGGDGALEAFFGGGFGGVGELCDFEEGMVVDEAEEEEFAVARGEVVEDGVEVEFEIGFARGLERSCGGVGLHAGPFLFVAFAAGVDAADIGAGEVGGFVEPAGEGGEGVECVGALGEKEKDGLGGVFGAVGIVEEAAGVGVYLGEVAIDELAEGGFVAVLEEGGEEIGVGELRSVGVHCGEYVRWGSGRGQKFLGIGCGSLGWGGAIFF